MKIRDYIQQQPSVLEAMLCDRRAFGDLEPGIIDASQQLLLVGTGSSMNAILASVHHFRALGKPVSCASPMTAIQNAGHHGPKTLAIVLSQSGCSKDAVDAARKLQAAGCHLIVMTGDAASPIAKLDCDRLILPVADETVGPKTKGYFASVLGLSLLANALHGKWPKPDAADLSQRLMAWTNKCEAWARALAPDLSKADVLAVLGQGAGLGTAQEGSLKIAEMSGIPAFGEETEEMSHGRFHGLTCESHVFFLVFDGPQSAFVSRLGAALSRFDITPHVIDMTAASEDWSICSIQGPQLPAGDGGWASLFAIVPFQMLAVHAAECRDIVPEEMRYPDMGKYLGLKLQVPV